jgi:hypothetical protein
MHDTDGQTCARQDCSRVWGGGDDEEALVPGRVVGDVVLQRLLHKAELRLPEAKGRDDRLPVRPRVVVLCVDRQTRGGKLQLLLRQAHAQHHS